MYRNHLFLFISLLLVTPHALAAECTGGSTSDIPVQETTAHSEDEILVTGLDYFSPSSIRERRIRQLTVRVSDIQNADCSTSYCTVFSHEFDADGTLRKTLIKAHAGADVPVRAFTLNYIHEEGVLVDVRAKMDDLPEGLLSEASPHTLERVLYELQTVIDTRWDFQETTMRYLPPDFVNLALYQLEHAPSPSGLPEYAIAYPLDSHLNIDASGITLHVDYHYTYDGE